MIIDTHNIIHPALQSPEHLLRKMDRAGVDMAVVYCAHGRFFDNDYASMAVRRYPSRFIGLAYLNPTREGVNEEIKRVRDLGLRGVALNPKYDRYPLSIGSRWFMDQIYSYCLEHDFVILAEGWGDDSNSMPYQFRDMAWSFPELKIILAHMGMMGGYGDVQRVAQQCQNLFLNTSTTTSSQIAFAVQTAGAEKVLLGTNTPIEFFEVSMKKVEVAIPDPEQRKLVYGDNARRILEIE